MDLVRLACVKRAASVHPEPGSNSPTKICPTQPTTKVIDQAKALSQKSATYRSEETSREGSRVRCVLAVLAHRIEINAKNESIVTTGRYPCLVPPGTVTPKLTGQIQQPPESDRSSARTGILSSLLFSRSSKPVAHALTWSSPRMMTSMHRPSDSYCLHGAKNESITIPGPAQPRLKELVRRDGATSCPSGSAGTSREGVCGR